MLYVLCFSITTNVIFCIINLYFFLQLQVEKSETNKNDYGLNDVSARDSSEDESVPKKPVPIWAKRMRY